MSDSRKTATSINEELHAARLAFYELTSNPGSQAETIAKHYVAHATMALQILKIIEARRHSDTPAVFDPVIELLIEQLKQDHRRDFGIALEWPLP